MMNECIDPYIKDPNLLIELCRAVINGIDRTPNNSNTAEKDAQLREIDRAVKQLEKMKVPVPDGLRAEKTRLAADLEIQFQSGQTLRHFAKELDLIVKDLNDRLGIKRVASNSSTPRIKRSRTITTDRTILRENIIKTLQTLGGGAKVADVIQEMGRQMKDKLLPGDVEWRENVKMYVWQHNTQWERYKMTQDGTLRNDSPRGYWELNEDQK
jgi:hypothetical protein